MERVNGEGYFAILFLEEDTFANKDNPFLYLENSPLGRLGYLAFGNSWSDSMGGGLVMTPVISAS